MKILYLVRHAKAIPYDVGVNDFKRSLTKRGRKDAKAVSKRVRKKRVKPDLFISSLADRALETAHIFAKSLGYPVHHVVLKEEIYENECEALIEIIKGIDNQYDTVMLFGHNPSLAELATYLIRNFDEKLRTTGIVGISFDIPGWSNILAASGSLVLFDFPRRLPEKVHKKAQKKITENLRVRIDRLQQKGTEEIVTRLSQEEQIGEDMEDQAE